MCLRNVYNLLARPLQAREYHLKDSIYLSLIISNTSTVPLCFTVIFGSIFSKFVRKYILFILIFLLLFEPKLSLRKQLVQTRTLT